MIYSRIKKLFAYAILFIISFAPLGCGLWLNFTTYFNTYYNAKTLFDGVEEALKAQNNDPFVFREEIAKNIPQTNRQPQQNYSNAVTNNYQTQNQNSTSQAYQTTIMTPQQINQQLTKVIEKCSKILQYDKESSYFDDALFMTGKSFYYQGEYARAQRKFLELSTLPESDYALENKLWLAKTYLQLRSFNDGLKLIEEVKATAIEQGDDELYRDASFTQIGFLVYREEYQAAIKECENFLKNNNDDETSALVWYQVGKIYIEQNDLENALKAFSSVLDNSPTFEIEYECRLERALLLKKMNKLEESENELIELSNEGKFKTKLSGTMLELGKIYYDKNDNQHALQTFLEIDSTYRNTPESGEASFMIGQLYELKFGQYDSAYKYYLHTVSSLAPTDIKTDAQNYSANINKYFSMKDEISSTNKSLVYLNDHTRYLQDSIDYQIAYKEYEELVKDKADSIETIATATARSSLSNVNQRSIYEQQAQTLIQQLTERKLNTADAFYKKTLVDLIAVKKAKAPEMPKMTVDSAKGILGNKYYNLGNLFFSELDVPDSAYYYYNLVLKNDPDSSVVVPTLFSLGTYYETEKQKEKADSIFQIIYDNYPNDKYYKLAGIKLGKIKTDASLNITDSSDPAEPVYLDAEKKFYNNNYKSAIAELRELYLNYPKSDFVPKAYYFIGLIYEENLRMYDSAAVFYGILSSREYAKTPYSKAVAPKYLVYKEEQDKIRKEQEELLKQKRKKLEADHNGDVNNISKDSTGVIPGNLNEVGKENVIKEDNPNNPVNRDSTLILKEDDEHLKQVDELPVKRDVTRGKRDSTVLQKDSPKEIEKNEIIPIKKNNSTISRDSTIIPKDEELIKRQDELPTAKPDSSKLEKKIPQ